MITATDSDRLRATIHGPAHPDLALVLRLAAGTVRETGCGPLTALITHVSGIYGAPADALVLAHAVLTGQRWVAPKNGEDGLARIAWWSAGADRECVAALLERAAELVGRDSVPCPVCVHDSLPSVACACCGGSAVLALRAGRWAPRLGVIAGGGR